MIEIPINPIDNDKNWLYEKVNKMMEKYLVMDTETTGLHEDSDLLTAWFGIYNSEFELIDELELYTKPDDGFYKVTAQALGVNKIDLIRHDEIALKYKETKPLLYKFIEYHFKLMNDGSLANPRQLIPIGQNCRYDINKICNTIISKGSWDTYVSRRPLDTMYIARWLQLIGKIPMAQSISLGDLIKYFGINIKGELHTAKTDAICTVEVLKEMLKL